MESAGTKGYTKSEIYRMLAPLPVTRIRIETFLTSADRIGREGWHFRLLNFAIELLNTLCGFRAGWFHGITARKLK
jgi:hypothetical protein